MERISERGGSDGETGISCLLQVSVVNRRTTWSLETCGSFPVSILNTPGERTFPTYLAIYVFFLDAVSFSNSSRLSMTRLDDSIDYVASSF